MCRLSSLSSIVYYRQLFFVAVMFHCSAFPTSVEAQDAKLPTQIDASSVMLIDRAEGLRKDEGMKTTKLKWLSVNKKIDDSALQPESWDDLDEIKQGCAINRDRA